MSVVHGRRRSGEAGRACPVGRTHLRGRGGQARRWDRRGADGARARQRADHHAYGRRVRGSLAPSRAVPRARCMRAGACRPSTPRSCRLRVATTISSRRSLGLPPPQPDFAVATISQELPEEADRTVLRLLVATLTFCRWAPWCSSRQTRSPRSFHRRARRTPRRARRPGCASCATENGELLEQSCRDRSRALRMGRQGSPQRQIVGVLSVDGWGKGLELIAEEEPVEAGQAALEAQAVLEPVIEPVLEPVAEGVPAGQANEVAAAVDDVPRSGPSSSVRSRRSVSIVRGHDSSNMGGRGLTSFGRWPVPRTRRWARAKPMGAIRESAGAASSKRGAVRRSDDRCCGADRAARADGARHADLDAHRPRLGLHARPSADGVCRLARGRRTAPRRLLRRRLSRRSFATAGRSHCSATASWRRAPVSGRPRQGARRRPAVAARCSGSTSSAAASSRPRRSASRSARRFPARSSASSTSTPRPTTRSTEAST